MTKITVGSFNIQDNSINRNGGIRPNETNNALILSRQMRASNVDILGAQKLTYHYANNLKLALNKYEFSGDYRYGNGLLKRIPYNENNNIISKYPITHSKTIHLPWVTPNFKDLKTSIQKMSIMPRIATLGMISLPHFNNFIVINTHLDYQLPSLQIEQLKALKEFITKYSRFYAVVVTGGFNMSLETEHFNEFVKELQKKGLTRVPIEEATWYGQDGTTKTEDHIFLPSNWQIEDAEVINRKPMTEISDHRLVLVRTKIK